MVLGYNKKKDFKNMNKLELSNVDASKGYPFSIDDLRFMLDGKTSNGFGTGNTGIYSAIESSAKALGDNYIVCGCEIYDLRFVNPGWIVLNGELLYFPGQTLGDSTKFGEEAPDYYCFLSVAGEKMNNGKKYKNGGDVPEVYVSKPAKLYVSKIDSKDLFMFCYKYTNEKGYYYTVYRHSVKIDNKSKKIDIHSQRGDIKLEAENINVCLNEWAKTGQTITIDSGDNGNIDIKSGYDLDLSADKNVNIDGTNVNITTVSNGSIKIDSDGHLNLEADGNVNIEANDFICFGNDGAKTYFVNVSGVNLSSKDSGIGLTEKITGNIQNILVDGVFTRGGDKHLIHIRKATTRKYLLDSNGVNPRPEEDDAGFKLEIWPRTTEEKNEYGGEILKLTRKSDDTKYKDSSFSGTVYISIY